MGEIFGDDDEGFKASGDKTASASLMMTKTDKGDPEKIIGTTTVICSNYNEDEDPRLDSVEQEVLSQLYKSI